MPETTRAPASNGRRSCTLVFLVALCATFVASSCGGPDPFARFPAGAWLAGDADALRRVLTRLERLELAPLGRDARELRERIRDCEAFSASSSEGDVAALFRTLGCSAPDELPPSLRSLLGEADLALLLPLGEAGRLAGQVHVQADGSLELDARFRIDPEATLASLLLPDDEPPGRGQLNGDKTLLHGRFRPEGGLNIAALVPDDSQASDLFRMKGELFAGAVLDGSLEFAAYLPEGGRQIPPLALAVGFRFRAPAVAAMEQFVRDLRSTWPVAPAPVTIAEHSGQCLENLRILPEFAPCYVVTDDVLLIGWDRASIARALQPGTSDGPGEQGGLYVYLDRFPEADRLLRETLGSPDGAVEFDYAWDRLVARTSVERGEYRLALELLAGEGS